MCLEEIQQRPDRNPITSSVIRVSGVAGGRMGRGTDQVEVGRRGWAGDQGQSTKVDIRSRRPVSKGAEDVRVPQNHFSSGAERCLIAQVLL